MEDIRERLGSFRARRLVTCRAIDDLHSVIKALGSDDGSDLPPEGGLPTPPSDAFRAELHNSVTALMRMILALNDGHVSPSQLQRF